VAQLDLPGVHPPYQIRPDLLEVETKPGSEFIPE
jgi:hypothetical protein